MLQFFLILGQEKLRIDAAVVEADGPVQMRAGNSSGHAYLADFLPSFNARPALDEDAAQVVEHADEPLTVIDKHGFAVKEIFSGFHNDSRQGGRHGRARGRRDIYTAVRLTRFVIEETAQSEDAADAAGRRQGKLQ